MRFCVLVNVLLVAASNASTVSWQEDEWQEDDTATVKLACGKPCNVPDSKGLPVACRSQWGSCGNSADHCNARSQWTRSACSVRIPGASGRSPAGGCMTGPEVADAWVAAANAVSAEEMIFHSQFTPQSFCASALAVAYGESFGTTRCPSHLDSQAVGGGGAVRGLWQLSNKLFGRGKTPIEQAKIVITKYSSNDPDYGCKASWQNGGCTAIDLPNQLNSCSNSHVFCNNVWTGQREVKADHYKKFVTVKKVQELCVAAYIKTPPTNLKQTTGPWTTTTKPPACGKPCNVPDSKGLPVACRSQWGSCGNSADHCNARSQWTRSACGSPATTAPTGEKKVKGGKKGKGGRKVRKKKRGR